MCVCVCVCIEMQLPLVALPTGAGTKPTPPPISRNRLVQAEAQRRNTARMEEAEALSTKITIMIGGRPQAIGSVNSLINKFCTDVSLLISGGKENAGII